ncbi:MAG TPA: DUF4382 domain-containing protein [Gemmatimonadales bacterium]|jgi:hypothetical protein|nr:DUF4382 domain-containing protein [Gemmatimonadales bacterium]
MPLRLLSSTIPRQAAFLLVGAAALLGACSDAGPAGTTALSIKLKDAPGEVQHAVVTIAGINLMGGSGKVVLTSVPVTTDLLTLASSTADLVSGVDVPSGTYTELRFLISGACLAVENDSGESDIYATDGYDATPCGGAATGVLQAPSFSQSGLKVTMDAGALTLAPGEKILLVDFDVSQSFGQAAGQVGKWVMHPVITGGELSAGAADSAAP